MGLIKDLQSLGKAVMGKDADPPESSALYSEYMFIKAAQESKRVKDQKKARQKNKKDKKSDDVDNNIKYE